ncbi:MAG TPA: BTAD domain-containing putative transcriptional regulator, partial [Acidimicrobiales bacterium]
MEVVFAGAPVGLSGQKARVVLAVLAAFANQTVSEDRLIEALWRDEPPRTARPTLQTYLSRLRKTLGGADAELRIESLPGGYRLRVPAGGVDVDEVEALARDAEAAAANGDHAAAVKALRDALSHWRGQGLGDIADTPIGVAPVARLEELRAHLTEQRVDAELALGLHGAIVGELESLCATYPSRERLWKARILALYRSGRQGDALRAYQDLRRHLSDELGLQPSPELRSLEAAVLAQDPDLDVAGPASSHGTRPPKDNVGTTVTLLFTDLVGSTEILDELGDERAENVRRAHFRLLRETVAAHGGREVKSLGDGLMIAFPSVVGSLVCAAQMQEKVEASNSPSHRALHLRIGINVGDVISEEEDFFGRPVVVAKRLCDRAEPGQVLVSDVAVSLLGTESDFLLRPVGLVPLKGLADPINTWELLWAPEGTPVVAERERDQPEAVAAVEDP